MNLPKSVIAALIVAAGLRAGTALVAVAHQKNMERARDLIVKDNS